VPEAAADTTRDYYAVLGVERDADDEAIKGAFRTRARALHPDVSDDPAAATKFRELSEAYTVLAKHSTRLLYDRFGYRGRGNGWFSPDGARAAGDFLRGRSPAVAEVLVDEYEAHRGVRRQIHWSESEPCDACEGDGTAPGAISMPCPACEGAGRQRVESSLANGERLLQIEDCPTCDGRGRLVSAACPACDGAGVTRIDESGEVDVPAGVRDGDRVAVGNWMNRDVVVRVLAAPPEHTFLRYAAVVGFVVALVFLWILLR
jgi:molecular chaperone DnaJ